MPGMVDTHIHASQYPNAGLGLDMQLLDWLLKYTFPMEARFQDPSFARSCYRKVVVSFSICFTSRGIMKVSERCRFFQQRTLYNGTTTASYFATIHKQACEILADIVEQVGQLEKCVWTSIRLTIM
jgi:guanine deaminase